MDAPPQVAVWWLVGALVSTLAALGWAVSLRVTVWRLVRRLGWERERLEALRGEARALRDEQRAVAEETGALAALLAELPVLGQELRARAQAVAAKIEALLKRAGE